MVAALEDQIIDTSTVVDTGKGRWRIYNHTVKDAHHGGYGKISFARALRFLQIRRLLRLFTMAIRKTLRNM